MIYLPLPATNKRLKSFWVVMSLTAALILSYSCHVIFHINWLPWTIGILIFILTAISGVLKPEIALLLYRIHNACARIFAQYAKMYLLYICFCILSIATGKKVNILDSHIFLENKSNWFSHEQKDSIGCDIEKKKMVIELNPRGFVRNFFQWTRQSGNWWIVVLLPFLFLISIFERKQHTYKVPENIYTLY